MLSEQVAKVRTGLVRLKSGRADETRTEQLADRARLVAATAKELESPTRYLAAATARCIATDADARAWGDADAERAAAAVQALLKDETGEAVLGASLKDALALVKKAVFARDQLASASWMAYADPAKWTAHQGVMGTLARIDVTDSKLVLTARRLHQIASDLADAGQRAYPTTPEQIDAFDSAADEFTRLFAAIGGDDAVPPEVLSFIHAASGAGAGLDAACAVSAWLEEHDLQRRFVVRLAQ